MDHARQESSDQDCRIDGLKDRIYALENEIEIAQDDSEVNSMRAVVKRVQEDRIHMETLFQSILSEREAAHEAELKRSLEEQHKVLQEGYLKLMQEQVDSLMGLIQKPSAHDSSLREVDGESCCLKSFIYF